MQSEEAPYRDDTSEVDVLWLTFLSWRMRCLYESSYAPQSSRTIRSDMFFSMAMLAAVSFMAWPCSKHLHMAH